MKRSLLLVLFALFLIKGSAQSIVRPDWAGFYTTSSNGIIDTNKYPFIKGLADRVRWSDVETKDGVYDWNTLDNSLNAAVNGGYYYYFVFWVGPDAPTWIYNKGVTKITTDFNGGKSFPDYKSTIYQTYFNRIIDKLADHIASLTPAQRKAIGFIQPAFGSTGDQQLLKGNVTSPVGYTITDQEYFDIFSKGTIRYYEAFNKPELANIKFLFNVDDPWEKNTGGQQLFADWLWKTYSIAYRKQQFTVAIGYQANGEIVQDNEQRPSFFGQTGKDPQFVRGEFSKYAQGGIFQENPVWNYYWTAISTVDRGLDLWEIDYSVIQTGLYNQGFDFANKYSYYKRPETSPYAFVALRDVLDASDVIRFPLGNQYGSTAAQSNTIRLQAIEQQFADHGAKIGDLTSASTLTNATYLLNAIKMNDVGYKLIARNYSRFITQIDANNTSVGWWRKGPVDQPYSRYARGFENASNKNRMAFDLDDNFFLNSPTNKSIDVKIIYLDEGTGKFSFRYNSTTEIDKIAQIFTKGNTNRWVEKTVKIEDGEFLNKGVNNNDFSLVNEDSEDDIFHMIEVSRSATLNNVNNTYIENNSNFAIKYLQNSSINWSSIFPIDRVVVYDISGKTIKEYATSTINSIDISAYRSGIYILKFYQKNLPVISKKIIKY